MDVQQVQPKLRIYNSLTRNKETFEALKPPFVGLYVCGPTVYSDVHLGNCRTFMHFDVIFRYLQFLGYKVRYVRNITDVGHLQNDADEGEDKIAARARLEQLEPMEIVQKYTNGFHAMMRRLNNIPPSIEPTATGHIVEQIEFIQAILKNGFAYESQGSIYFDVRKYAESHDYGELSGRKLDELLAGQRDLDGQSEKRRPEDFALWKKASPEHIMRWPSPWSDGFPGWHLECSVMSSKYLGESFDIHGGGMDLQFPHHECEIAQGKGAHGHEPVRYWMHANMLTLNGQKMSKSLGNVINPDELFTGDHPTLTQAYSPMVLRFFTLQTHYRSTMDLSDEALSAAKQGYRKLMNGLRIAKELQRPESFTGEGKKHITQLEKMAENAIRGLNDDFNTAMALAQLFNFVKKLNSLKLGQIQPEQLSEESFALLTEFFPQIVEEVLGLQEETPDFSGLVQVLLDLYAEAKAEKAYDKVDELRARAKAYGIVFRDLKSGVDWAYEE
jgi:cysteinyl-tRNA synthetase